MKPSSQIAFGTNWQATSGEPVPLFGVLVRIAWWTSSGYNQRLMLAGIQLPSDSAGEPRTLTGVHMTMTAASSDDDVGRQIIGVFYKYKICPGGILRRNRLAVVIDADFQRGMNKADSMRAGFDFRF